MIIIIADVDEVATLLDMDESRAPEIILPQTSGPCVHYDEQTEYAADADPCTYPYGDGCPHLDNPDVLCPIKDACYAMREVARMRDACEAEQEEQDADMAAQDAVYETETPEFVEPGRLHTYVVESAPDDGAPRTYTVPAPRKPHPSAWSDEEGDVIRRAQSAAEAGRLYSETYGIWKRTQSAVTSRWYRLQAAGKLIAPEPEEPDFTVPHPTFRPGDRVRIKHALHRGHTGEIVRYFPATENYLVAIDGMPDKIVLADEQMEGV